MSLKKQISSSMNRYSNIHFIGCGGAGMAPLANIMLQKGFQVSGSDLQSNVKTDTLKNAGLTIFTGHDPSNIPAADNTLVVYSSAVSNDNPELSRALERGLRCLRRGAMLAEVAEGYKRSVAIGGSHGKTTVTAMLTHIMLSCTDGCGYMIGGKVNGWEANSAAGNGDVFITEVDESDGTIALISPYLGLITNIEDDHSWSVGGSEVLMENFYRFAGQSNHLIRFDDKKNEGLFQEFDNSRANLNLCSSLLGSTESRPSALKSNSDGGGRKSLEPFVPLVTTLVINSAIALNQYSLPPEWGEYQCLNGILAINAALYLDVEQNDAIKALCSFPGVARRMTTWLDNDNLTVIEDYAHHPTEVAVAIKTLRKRFPKHHL
jgi:UDP-N-acetylmuramate--alanine ligase